MSFKLQALVRLLSLRRASTTIETFGITRHLEHYQPRPKRSILDCGIHKKLPDAYRKFYTEWKLTTPAPVHYIPVEGKYYKDAETGQVYPVHNVPIPLSECPQEDNGIWGGEAIIDGFKRLLKGEHRVHDLGPCPRFWYPILKRTVIYSEILDKYMVCEVTERALYLINKHHGLDSYLLETRACDLRNSLAVKLKRKILLALLHKSLYHEDKTKQKEIYDKYKKHLDNYTPEEIDWYGLTLLEATKKLFAMNHQKRDAPKIPLKHLYRKEFIQELKEEALEKSDATPWYKRKLLPSFK